MDADRPDAAPAGHAAAAAPAGRPNGPDPEGAAAGGEGTGQIEVEAVAEPLPGVWEHFPGVITARLEDLLSWGRASSLWYLLFGIACCAIELMGAGAARYDLDRMGSIFRASPRQADLMIVAGTVTEKMAPVIERLYHQMAEPRWVIAMGACASAGGPYWQGYTVVPGVDKVVPVDIYIPGCPPRPEALIQGILKLKEKVRARGRRAPVRGDRGPRPPER